MQEDQAVQPLNQGQPLTQPQAQLDTVTLQLPHSMVEDIDKRIPSLFIDRSELIRNALRNYLERLDQDDRARAYDKIVDKQE